MGDLQVLHENRGIGTERQSVSSECVLVDETVEKQNRHSMRGNTVKMSTFSRMLERQKIETNYARVVKRFDQMPSWMRHHGNMDRPFSNRSVVMRNLLESWVFELLISTLIVSNTAFIAFTSHLSLQRALDQYRQTISGEGTVMSEEPACEAAVEMVFKVIFAVELLLRIVAWDGRVWMSPDWGWGLMDAMLVLSSVIEHILDVSTGNGVLRVLRLLRILRILRLLRFARIFRKLRIMVLAVLNSAVPLLWATVLLSILLFFFSVFFMQGVAHYVSDLTVLPDPDVEVLRDFFGNLPMTFLTLFMAVTGGLSWWEVGRPLLGIGVQYVLLFALFVVIMMVAVLNVVTAIFVNDALEVASKDREEMLQLDKDRSFKLCADLQRLFEKLDSDHSGTISLEEFEEALELEEIRDLLTEIGISITDASKTFRQLDADGSGELEIDEFVMGCMRLRSSVPYFELEMLVNDNRRFMRDTAAKQHRLETHINLLSTQVMEATARLTISESARQVAAALHPLSEVQPTFPSSVSKHAESPASSRVEENTVALQDIGSTVGESKWRARLLHQSSAMLQVRSSV